MDTEQALLRLFKAVDSFFGRKKACLSSIDNLSYGAHLLLFLFVIVFFGNKYAFRMAVLQFDKFVLFKYICLCKTSKIL